MPGRRCRGQADYNPAGIGQKPGVIPQALYPFAGTCDDVEVLAEAKNVEQVTEHSPTMRAQAVWRPESSVANRGCRVGVYSEKG